MLIKSFPFIFRMLSRMTVCLQGKFNLWGRPWLTSRILGHFLIRPLPLVTLLLLMPLYCCHKILDPSLLRSWRINEYIWRLNWNILGPDESSRKTFCHLINPSYLYDLINVPLPHNVTFRAWAYKDQNEEKIFLSTKIKNAKGLRKFYETTNQF